MGLIFRGPSKQAFGPPCRKCGQSSGILAFSLFCGQCFTQGAIVIDFPQPDSALPEDLTNPEVYEREIDAIERIEDKAVHDAVMNDFTDRLMKAIDDASEFSDEEAALFRRTTE